MSARVLKFIQINIYKGKYFEALLDFLKKQDADVITMQEVTVGGFNLTDDKSVNLFEILKEKLKLNGVYYGDLKLTGSADSSFGNAVLTKFEIKKSRVITLKKFRPVSLEELDGASAFEIRPKISRHMLDVLVGSPIGGLHVLSVHGAWTAPPQDTPENLRQAELIKYYLKLLNKDDQPFVLGGDLNVTPNTKVINMINSVANNLMINSPFEYTTHPKIHKIVPRKFLVDYIFSSKHFKVFSLNVPEVTVSDHSPVVAELELMDD
ncbi:MAG: hypothetical protein UT12_C0011G0032 [Candidatus Curtissbacteria bacterium GW2011_GWC2_38_9]|uniref:Endonuclease/exonuclease/phosphatase domain-containing protein n=1 Tax=Candidatus Curtissbacteria bacterium GW2011_GWC2_38_9 TaxID=1618414 RepID=A0A0G0PJS8_9BACT|nr:MAG: hypothetical protein UT12_C0011G0032 [Candidatus Curtissbacteria bacterium GW2011_GWC2_38_9]